MSRVKEWEGKVMFVAKTLAHKVGLLLLPPSLASVLFLTINIRTDPINLAHAPQ